MTHFGRLLCAFTVVSVVFFAVVYSGTFAALDPIVVPLVALTLSSATATTTTTSTTVAARLSCGQVFVWQKEKEDRCRVVNCTLGGTGSSSTVTSPAVVNSSRLSLSLDFDCTLQCAWACALALLTWLAPDNRNGKRCQQSPEFVMCVCYPLLQPTRLGVLHWWSLFLALFPPPPLVESMYSLPIHTHRQARTRSPQVIIRAISRQLIDPRWSSFADAAD